MSRIIALNKFAVFKEDKRMKQLILAASLLALSTLAIANPNSPANRCKRYAHANSFQLTISQLCGGTASQTYQDVINDQSCEAALGSKEAIQEQQNLQSNELKNEYQRIGAQQFCSKYANRR